MIYKIDFTTNKRPDVTSMANNEGVPKVTGTLIQMKMELWYCTNSPSDFSLDITQNHFIEYYERLLENLWHLFDIIMNIK